MGKQRIKSRKSKKNSPHKENSAPRDSVLEFLDAKGIAKASERNVSDRHPWRLCPPGQHWRRPNIQKTYVRPSDGVIVREHLRSGGCCDNPSEKDQLYADEIVEISKHFKKVKDRDRPELLNAKDYHPYDPNLFDDYIAGWTKYWNEVFDPKDPLDPNHVKALIASESHFDLRPKEPKLREGNYARGPLQITDETKKILADEKGELKDHLINLTRDNVYDPNLSVCAAIRWLFHKRERASAKLGRQATWEEAVLEYKSYLKQYRAGKLPSVKMKEFYKAMKQLEANSE